MRPKQSKYLRSLAAALAIVVLLCGGSFAASTEYVFTAAELYQLSTLVGYADTDCSADYVKLSNYISGTGSVTEKQALAALKRIQAYDAASRSSASAISALVSSKEQSVDEKYIINTKSRVFHEPDCSHIQNMKPQNKYETDKTYQQLVNEGYRPCGHCIPTAK